MYIHRSIAILSSLLLSSCGGGGDTSNADAAAVLQVQVAPTETIRQIVALEGNTFRLTIVVNSGAPQIFTLNNSGEDINVNITGIRSGELNDIDVTWSEILNGFDVEISRQRQSILVSDNINTGVVTAPHQFTLFDYDDDGISNYDERIAGTCVWTVNDCEVDVPTTPTNNPPNSNDSELGDTNTNTPTQNGSLIQNGDFSQAGVFWDSAGLFLSTSDTGEFCGDSRVESQLPENASLFQTERLPLNARQTYRVSIDIRSRFPASPRIRFQTGPPGFTEIHQEIFAVTPTTTTFSSTFESRAQFDAIFTVQFGDGTDNNYCVDNIIVVPI